MIRSARIFFIREILGEMRYPFKILSLKLHKNLYDWGERIWVCFILDWRYWLLHVTCCNGNCTQIKNLNFTTQSLAGPELSRWFESESLKITIASSVRIYDCFKLVEDKLLVHFNVFLKLMPKDASKRLLLSTLGYGVTMTPKGRLFTLIFVCLCFSKSSFCCP